MTHTPLVLLDSTLQQPPLLCTSSQPATVAHVPQVTLVEKLFGENLANVTKSVAVLASSIVIMFVWGQWQMCLVGTVLLPVLALSITVQNMPEPRTWWRWSYSSLVLAHTSAAHPITYTCFRAVCERSLTRSRPPVTVSLRILIHSCPFDQARMRSANVKIREASERGVVQKDEEEKKTAGSLIGEIVLGIRTVASFNAETRFYEQCIVARPRPSVSPVTHARHATVGGAQHRLSILSALRPNLRLTVYPHRPNPIREIVAMMA